jgi:hypothetical protein
MGSWPLKKAEQVKREYYWHKRENIAMIQERPDYQLFWIAAFVLSLLDSPGKFTDCINVEAN